MKNLKGLCGAKPFPGPEPALPSGWRLCLRAGNTPSDGAAPASEVMGRGRWRCGGGGFVFQTRPGVGSPWLSLESPAVPLGGARIESPLKTVDFLDGYADILDRRFEGSSPEDLLDSSGKYMPFPVSRCAVPGGKQPVALPPHSFNDDSSADTSLCPALRLGINFRLVMCAIVSANDTTKQEYP